MESRSIVFSKRRDHMKLNSIKDNTQKISLILAILGVVSYVVHYVPYMGALGSLLLVVAFVILLAKSVRLKLTQKKMFKASLIIEVAGGVVYIMHLILLSLRFLDLLSFLLFVVAFVLLFRSQIQYRN